MMYIDITNQYLLQFKYMYMMRLIYIFLYHAASWMILGSFAIFTRVSKDTNKFVNDVI